jgi:hypothetical protein
MNALRERAGQTRTHFRFMRTKDFRFPVDALGRLGTQFLRDGSDY